MPNPDPHPIDVSEQPTAPPRTAAEGKLWAALNAHPATTAAELATAAGIGRSTAAKILARWATGNLVTRTAATTTTAAGGPPGRAAERWSIANLDDNVVLPGNGDDPDSHPHNADDPSSDAHRDVAGNREDDQPDAGPIEARGKQGDGDDASVTDAPEAPARPGAARATATTATATDGRETSDGVSTVGSARERRLPPGGLRGMVEDYLREHPDQAFGPSELGRKLGRSGGAVANALVKLVEAGSAVCAQAKPLRYTLAPVERDAQAAPAPSRVTDA
jgi:DNA-binding MarR family transcriptional regulator